VIVHAVLAAAVLGSVALHRLTVGYLYWRLERRPENGFRLRRQLASVVILVAAHCVEVTLFALGMLVVLHTAEAGVAGMDATDFETLLYFSFSVYSSLGFGDLVPTGALRIYCGVQVIVGLLLIAWSATALFGEVSLGSSARPDSGAQ